MRTSTFNYIKDILADFYKTDEYIRQREEELRHPYQEADLNAGIRGQGLHSVVTERMAITIAMDRRLCNLERNRDIIKNCLAEADEQTRVIIEELYMKKRPSLTLIGLAQQLFISKSQAYKLRNHFFEAVADELGM